MHEPLHLAGVDHLVPERIHDLRATACETRGIRREPANHDGLLTRTRGVGRPPPHLARDHGRGARGLIATTPAVILPV